MSARTSWPATALVPASQNASRVSLYCTARAGTRTPMLPVTQDVPCLQIDRASSASAKLAAPLTLLRTSNAR